MNNPFIPTDRTSLLPFFRMAWPNLKDDTRIVHVLDNPHVTGRPWKQPPEVIELTRYEFKPVDDHPGVIFIAAYRHIICIDIVYVLETTIEGNEHAWVYLYMPIDKYFDGDMMRSARLPDADQ
jgi:hypothetical protein